MSRSEIKGYGSFNTIPGLSRVLVPVLNDILTRQKVLSAAVALHESRIAAFEQGV